MKKIDKGTIIIIIVIIIISTAITYTAIERKKTLNSDFPIGKATINEVLKNVSKGTTGNENIARYYYKFSGKIFYQNVSIYEGNVKKNDCYEIKIANKNPGIHKINLNKKINCSK